MQKNQILAGFEKAQKEVSQSIQKPKIQQFSKKTDFWKKSRLKGRGKVAVRNAVRNKLIKKYGLFAYKHQNELL